MPGLLTKNGKHILCGNGCRAWPVWEASYWLMIAAEKPCTTVAAMTPACRQTRDLLPRLRAVWCVDSFDDVWDDTAFGLLEEDLSLLLDRLERRACALSRLSARLLPIQAWRKIGNGWWSAFRWWWRFVSSSIVQIRFAIWLFVSMITIYPLDKRDIRDAQMTAYPFAVTPCWSRVARCAVKTSKTSFCTIFSRFLWFLIMLLYVIQYARGIA